MAKKGTSKMPFGTPAGGGIQLGTKSGSGMGTKDPKPKKPAPKKLKLDY